MTAEHVQMYAKAYRLYFSGGYDFIKYQGQIATPPLLKQRDRQFYYRLSKKLNDEQIHATFLLTYFYKPQGFVGDACTPEAMSTGVRFASRAENGLELLKTDLYDLRKRVTPDLVIDWLYGERLADGSRSQIPPCMGDVIAGTLPLDLACILLLIPQPSLNYHWTDYWSAQSSALSSFGMAPWIDRLRKVDQLIHWRRPHWRRHGHLLSAGVWSSYRRTLEAPVPEQVSLFT